MRRSAGPVRRRTGSCLAAIILGLAGTAEARASAQAPPDTAAAGTELTVYVMTMGVGEEVWERFGHNAIIVEDRRRGTSIAYNYGMFSFRQENFLLRFIQGRMLYWVAGSPAEEEPPRYMALGRSVWRQELNLTPAQRVLVRDALARNVLPENRFYRYDYYLDNCSTRVRDVIDGALGGAFKAQMHPPASGTYRFHTQRLNANNPLLFLGLMLAEGERTDQPISRWEEMFLPLKLQEYLRDVRLPDTGGGYVPLVIREDTLFASDAWPVPDEPPDWRLAFLAVGSALGAVLWFGGHAGRHRPAARRLLLWLGTAWAGITGLAGVILAGLWALTDHTIASRNENVLQATIFALALAVVLPFALRDRPGALRSARALALVVGGLSVAGLVLKVLPGFLQVNGEALALMVPANIGLAAGVLAWVRGQER